MKQSLEGKEMNKPLYDEDGPDRVLIKATGQLGLVRCAICGARVGANAYETGSLGARYCSDECVTIAKAFHVYGRSRVLIHNLREADDIIEAWEQRLERILPTK